MRYRVTDIERAILIRKSYKVHVFNLEGMYYLSDYNETSKKIEYS